MAWIPMAIGAASSLLGAHKQSQAAMAPIEMGKKHYKEGSARIAPEAYKQAAFMFAPGFFKGSRSPLGGALVQQALGLLRNPGQIGPQHREQIAEAQNRAMNMLRWALPGMAAQSGMQMQGAPSAMYLSGLMNAQNQANEAYRQLATMQEGLRRQDIGMGQNIYQGILNALLQKQLGEAQTLINAPIPQVQAAQAGGAAGGLGNFLGGLLGSKAGSGMLGKVFHF